MIDLLLFIAGIVLVLLLVVLGMTAVIAGLGGVAAGNALERLGDTLVPGRKTGLGATGIVDQCGTIVRAIEPAPSGGVPQGTIQVAGELWKARCANAAERLAKGQEARVLRVEGMVAIVEDASVPGET